MRIDTVEGVLLGAGSLITERTILTCAHVVRGLGQVRVTFPGDGTEMTGDVESITGWEKPGDRGDVALVQLTADAPVEPAPLALPGSGGSGAVLRAYGFRDGMEQSGTYVTLLTGDDMIQQREWQQLDVDLDHPERLLPGFSGAAVYLAESGQIVGMVTDADLENEGRLGRMLPVDALRRYWEELDDRLPLPWLEPGHRRALRRIVTGQQTTLPLPEIYARALRTPLPAHRFGSVWDAIRYVAEERLEDGALSCFLDHLTDQLPPDAAARLRAWRGEVLPGSAGETPTARTSILIRLERLTRNDSYDLTMCTLIDGRPGRRLPTVQVPGGQVRAHVEKSLPTLLPDVVGRDWMFEFALPESWLGKPVEEWKAGDGIPMSTKPVVVRDVERMKPAMRQDGATRRWARLRTRAALQPVPPIVISCQDQRPRKKFFAWLDADPNAGVLVHTQRPRSAQLTAALDAGIPVMIWPRVGCVGRQHERCTCHLLREALLPKVEDAHPDELPEVVMELRQQANAADAETPHCGRKLTLFWDDPARLPDPPLSMGLT